MNKPPLFLYPLNVKGGGGHPLPSIRNGLLFRFPVKKQEKILKERVIYRIS